MPTQSHPCSSSPRRITFYHSVQPVNNLDLFMYIVVVECWSMHSRNLIHMLDFVQRMRMERLNGYILLYRDLSDQLDEADSSYHSASQESENERASWRYRNMLNRSSISPAVPFPEEEEDQGLRGEVLTNMSCNTLQRNTFHDCS